MFKKFNTPIKAAAILSLILAFALSTAWAVTHYSASIVIDEGGEGEIEIVNDGDDEIEVEIELNALDDYLNDEDIDEVTITVDVTEELVPCGGGTHYHLDFTFGPSGAYFAAGDPLELELEGKYVTTGCHVWLYNEDGEALEGTRDDDDDEIEFKIPHFSSYSYDMYDY